MIWYDDIKGIAVFYKKNFIRKKAQNCQNWEQTKRTIPALEYMKQGTFEEHLASLCYQG